MFSDETVKIPAQYGVPSLIGLYLLPVIKSLLRSLQGTTASNAVAIERLTSNSTKSGENHAVTHGKIDNATEGLALAVDGLVTFIDSHPSLDPLKAEQAKNLLVRAKDLFEG